MSSIACPACSRRSPRTIIGRRTDDVHRAVGQEILRLRLDAGISQRRLAEAAGVPQSYLSRIERGEADPSLAVLVAIGQALGTELSLRLMPGTGPRIRDRLQAPIGEALLKASSGAWKALVEVSVWRPARGVIDVVLARPATIVIAVEIHSELHRLEQQFRWASSKAESLPSAAAWSMLSESQPGVQISQLLILRSTRANRATAKAFEQTFRTAFPAPVSEALSALRDPAVDWPGPALLWAEVAGGGARILERAPRGLG